MSYSSAFRALWLGAVLLLALALTRPAQAQNTQLAFAQAAVVGTVVTANATIGDMAVVADGQGNTYVAGSFAGTVSFGAYVLTSADNRYDVFVAKRNAVGTYLWAEQGGGPGEQRCKALAIDVTGSVYVTGHFTSAPTVTFGSTTLTNAAAGGREEADVFVAKLNGAAHSWEWANRAGGGTRINGSDYGTAIAVDGLGNVYVAGTFDSSVAFFGNALQVANPYPGFDNIFLGKLTPAGAWVWAKGQDYMGQTAAGLTVDTNQNVYLTGIYYRGQATFGLFNLTSWLGEAFVAKVDGSGTWQWATGTGPTLRTYNYSRQLSISAVTTDGARGLYVAGGFGYGDLSADTLIVGNTILTNTGALSPPGPSGRIHRTFNAYVARLDAATGTWRWAVQSTGTGDENFAAPQVDGAGHVYVSGSFGEPNFSASATPGNTFGTTTLHSAGSTDIVVAQLDTAGRWMWARQAGGPNSEYAALCSVDAQGRGVLAGSFTGPTGQVGAFTLTPFNPAQSWTYFTAVLGPNGPLANLSSFATPGFEVFPNPARTTVSVVGVPPGQAVQVLDVLGRLVLSSTVPARGDLQLALPAGLPAGMYMVRAGQQTRCMAVE